MGTKKTTKQTSNTTQTAAPPTWTQPGIEDVSKRVTAAVGQGPKPYEGNFVALPDQATTQAAIDAYLGTAGRSEELANFMQTQLPALMERNNTRYDVGNFNDTLAPAIDAAIFPVFRQLQEQVLPGIRSSSLDSGAYSGDRAMMVLPQNAIKDASENAQRIGAEMAFNDYQAREARRLEAYGLDESLALERTGMLPELIDNILRSSAGGAQMREGALNLGVARDQAMIDNDLRRHDYNVRAPYEGLDIATQLLTALSQGWGTQTGKSDSTTVEKTGGLGAVAQGLLGAASLAGSFLMPGAGGAAAAAAGGMPGQAISAGFNTMRSGMSNNPWARTGG